MDPWAASPVRSISNHANPRCATTRFSSLGSVTMAASALTAASTSWVPRLPNSSSATSVTTMSPATTAVTPAPAAGRVEVDVAATKLGKVVVSSGRTLYAFVPDTATTSACSGQCATTWPPLVSAAAPGAGLDAGDFATITRSDGTTQVTFYGHPLYFFVGDAKPGDTNGEGILGKWNAVTPDGTLIPAK